jgi:ketosteroid isomerase-like protein
MSEENAFDPITDELVALARDTYRMFVEGDPAFLDAWDAEIEFHVPDTLPNGGALHGHMEVLAFFETVSGLWENPRPEPEEFLAAGDKLVVLGTWRAQARSTGVDVELPFAHVQQFRAGKVVYFRNYIDAAKVLQSLEGPASGQALSE